MLAKTPPMGFNTWNTFGENICDEVIRSTADMMVDKGLLDAGYEYLVIDDCWSKRRRDPETGKIVPDPEKFPEGMKAVSDYVHSKGLKFGMYSCAGTRTCANYPGSFDHEYLDAKTFAEYGADFLKYDFCYKPPKADGPLLYRRMSNALRASGREILFSACNWGCDDVETWIRSTGAHMYRSTGDICDTFESMRDIALSQIDKIAYSGNHCYNDMDMLTVGMFGKGNVGRENCCDENDYTTEFALWCMFGVPLMLGCDIRKLDGRMLELVKNRTLIRINQDEESRPPYVTCGDSGKVKTFFRVLSDNEYALMFANFDDRDHRACFYLETAGFPAASGYGLHLTDALTAEDCGVVKEFMDADVKAHGCKIYLCRQAC